MKLIVSDFDGTYFTDDYNIKINNDKINKFRNNNVFMLSSGRSYNSLKEMVNKYNIEYDYLSCCDGSILYDNKGNIIVKYLLNTTIIKKYLNLQKYVQIEKIQYSYDDDYYSKLSSNKLLGLNIVIKNENINNKFLKEFYLLKDRYLEYDFLVYKHDDRTYFCLKNKNINKSSTIDKLKELLKIKYDDIYVFGDNDNDYAMLSKYNGYYIGNVENNIKDICIKGYNQIYEFIDEEIL